MSAAPDTRKDLVLWNLTVKNLCVRNQLTLRGERLQGNKDIEAQIQELQAAQNKADRFVDPLPVGKSANASFVPLPSAGGLPLADITVWFAKPLLGDSTVLLRVYRYRRTSAGVFTYTQMNDTVTLTAADPWCEQLSFRSAVRTAVVLKPTDMVVIATDYQLNGSPDNARALTVRADIALQPDPTAGRDPTGEVSEGPAWLP